MVDGSLSFICCCATNCTPVFPQEFDQDCIPLVFIPVGQTLVASDSNDKIHIDASLCMKSSIRSIQRLHERNVEIAEYLGVCDCHMIIQTLPYSIICKSFVERGNELIQEAGKIKEVSKMPDM